MKKFYQLLILFSNFVFAKQFDLTVVGNIRFTSSLARNAILHIDCLKDHLKINFVTTDPKIDSMENVSEAIQRIVNNPERKFGNFVMLDTSVWSFRRIVTRTDKKDDPTIKVAYTMIEYTQIPDLWVRALNQYFDVALVPDEWLVDVYKKCGVKIPVYAIPHPIYIEEFLSLPLKKQPNKPFVFATSSIFSSNKNVPLLLEAFAKEFGNNPDVMLKLHSHWNYRIDEIRNKIASLKLKNVDLHVGDYSWQDYIKYFASMDCYVLLSRGEGFSVTPREAMAGGIPVIISDATAHKVITDSCYVRSVRADIFVPHDGEFYGGRLGGNFSCKVDEAASAMRDVYNNYSSYLQKTTKARDWVKQYMPKNLTNIYLSFFKPRQVILGKENKIYNGILITDSELLYKKYKNLYGKKKR